MKSLGYDSIFSLGEEFFLQLCPEYKASTLPASYSMLAQPGEDFLNYVSWKIGFCHHVVYSGLVPGHGLGKSIIAKLHIYIRS